ncbi:MAG: hypothetical protein KAT69_03200 [Candidatus Aminicenantes bacterium]|nr:hypothetical protein [Candidatus Aminicenantes bacterium]
MAWQFPNLISETLVEQLITEGLLKYSLGDPKIEFSVPIHWFDELEIFHNIRIQDPFGMSTTGAGEKGRYYYIETLSYDFMADKIDVVAVDLQYILRRYFILGDEGAQALNWSSAGESDRMYGYLCDEDTDRFADGEPGKALVDEGILENY